MDSKKKYPFASNHRGDWLKAARKELGGQDPMAELSKKIDGLTIRPYYDATDLDFAIAEPLPVSDGPYPGARAWINAPMVAVNDESQANKTALEHLNSGADGIVFKVNSEVDLPKLLSDIQLPFCSISFTNASAALVQSYGKWIARENLEHTTMSGALFSNEFHADALYGNYPRITGLRPAGIDIPFAPPADQLFFAMNAVVCRLLPVDSQAQARQFLSQAAFCFPVETAFFGEIAKLKSFRILWTRLLAAYHIEEPVSPHVHALSNVWTNEKLDPNANMLKATTATLAAILGGADVVTTCEATDQPFKARIARNVSSILREESRISIVSDPTAGSYFLESLVHELTESVWARLEKEVSR